MTEILTVDASRASDVLAVVHESFSNRPPLDPPTLNQPGNRLNQPGRPPSVPPSSPPPGAGDGPDLLTDLLELLLQTRVRVKDALVHE